MRWLFLLLLLGVVRTADGQQIPTELICSWRNGARVPEKAAGAVHRQFLGRDTELLRFPDALAAAKALAALRRRPEVLHLHYNYRVTPRNTPDDPLYPRQENMRRAGFEAAWNLTTGGFTPEGHPIVVAVLDAGFDADHPDLLPNLWSNPGEVAGDDVDNDGNGLVDDVHGWNFTAAEPVYDPDTHGTAVAGLLGAAGNNGRGVAGTNWDSHLMLLQIATVADIIAAYEYVIDQRRAFNASDGRSGAFVVATNASFGIEGATCNDFPGWGRQYDRLGEVGVLTAASVANVAEDVDAAGDMPTDCPSEYLIGVTNLDADDRLFPSAGYGRVAVDLAAPGEGSYTTRPGNAYGTFGSTSAAAPYVTGAIALLYATPVCPALALRARTAPAATARLMRKAVLTSVRKREALIARTATGGVLDVAAAQLVLVEECSTTSDSFTITSAFPNPTAGRLTLVTTLPAVSNAVSVSVYDATGRRVTTLQPEILAVAPVRLTIDLGSLPGGYYLLEVSDGEHRAVFPGVVF
ncbi:subtilisin family serine protease [Lewinella marina]|uniref:Peptidase S8/S53 domain-containing protein n=1 Tax=Neolewinella marina TaxID=438751 RepID=A0A2G0CHQ2_9BACT|nr:S8 family serine peptidase [Neolewinella marina]NJB85386.1 subtilisin family serine protease [Neolewinella marina]PHK99501.1 hypothetical protein CGL56_00115 [Neolewinella marina]